MPRLSLYKPEKGNDYKFIDRQASEMFQVGGTDVYVHKYMGTETTDENGSVTAKDHTQIQDLMFLENRDRKYDPEVYRIRGLYNVQNIDFNLSQFGLFIDNDTLYMTVHINDFIKYVGRKPLSGDVMELPHLRDDFALDDHDISLPRYYVIEDVGRASEGFSVTWFPHLYRLKLKKITDSQQFADILKQPALDSMGNPDANGTTLKDLLSTYQKELAINDAVLAEAEADAPLSGYETRQFFTLAVDPTTGKPVINQTADIGDQDASLGYVTSDSASAVPKRSGYTGYLVGDGWAPNGLNAGAQFGHGIQFPSDPVHNDFFLRTDFFPNRLFRFDTKSWIPVEDNVRMTMTNEDPTKPISDTNPSRQTLKTGFINNTKYTYNDAVASSLKTYSQVNIDSGVSIIDTNIDYAQFGSAKYVVLKQSVVVMDYVASENPPDAPYPGLITSNNGNVRITLPTGVVVPYAGQWTITLYNYREAERQSLSKALKPRADL